ncbi:EAL domain-containing protein [Ferrimonas sediminum]|uniref:EAL domain-containing protein n=1 Tax=Ferrimonas sediminum TaxID=718193 RepID=A0A1G8SAP5_9GAMM|nr:EAL domain-containing protein [Ferrimonas sediminum]
MLLCDRLNRSRVEPQQLCVEITVTAAVAHLTKASELLWAKGVRFTLDDFGSGISSFGYIKALQVDYLKTDGDVVRDIGTDPQDRVLVVAIHNIGCAMGMAAVVECVEEDSETLPKVIGVNYAQGFGIAPPPSSAEVAVSRLGVF